MKRFLQDLWNKFTNKLLILIGLMVLISATEGLGLLLFLPLISFLSGSEINQSGTTAHLFQFFNSLGIHLSLGLLILIITAVFASQGMISIAQGKLIASLESSYVDNWRKQFLTALLKAKWSFFTANKAGDLLFIFGTETERLGRALLLCAQIASCSILLIIYLLITVYLSWQFSLLLTLVGLLGFIFITKGFAYKAYQTGASYAEHNSRLLAHVNEFIQSAKMIKTTNSENQVLTVSSKLLSILEKDYFGAVFYPYILRTILEVFIIIGVCFSLFLLHNIGITFDSIIILMAICLRILPKLHTLQSSYQLLIGYLPSFENLNHQLEIANQYFDEEIFATDYKVFQTPLSIRFHNVSMAYENHNALKQLSFEIGPGQICAIVGPSGAGKSTLIDLIVKIAHPNSGYIQINEALLENLSASTVRRSIGYVTQEPLLLHDTIWNNIAWGSNDYSEEDIVTASKLFNAHEFIQTLPLGYHTVVGERGAKLSGGQRQRIVLARAIISKPKLLILDEATSALDAESEQIIIETLNKLRGKLTILLVSHRIAPVRIADHILVLEAGKITQSGSWEQLIKQSGHFATLFGARQHISSTCNY